MKKNILVVFLIIIITLFGLVYIYKNKSKLIFKRLINNIRIDENKEINNYFTFKTNEGNILNDTSLKISIINNDIYALLNYKNSELLDIGIIENNNKLYLDLHKYYDNYIELDYNISKKDINIITLELFNALTKSLEKSKFISKKDINYLEINSTNKKIVIDTFVNYLKSSSKFFNSIYMINNQFDYNNLTNFLSNIIGDNFKIYIYTKDNKINNIVIERDLKEIINLRIKNKYSYEIKVNDNILINYNIKIKNYTDDKLNNNELNYKKLNILEKMEVFNNVKNKNKIQEIFFELRHIFFD